MGDRPTERRFLREFVVDVERIVISRKPREEDDIGLRDRSSEAFPLITNREVVEAKDRQNFLGHRSSLPKYS